MPNIPKTTFSDGRFIVISRLGDGGSAAVWRVVDTMYDVERAIKTLHLTDGENSLVRFQQEVQIMMRLNSANIVTVYESFVEDGQLHVVMEKCTGSLNSWSQMYGRMPPRLAVKVIIEMLKGLEKAHRIGVVHRDIKPHNVLIDEDGTGDVILIDVKAISLRTKNGYKVNRAQTKKQKELDVQLIFVDLDTKEVLDVMPTKRDKKVKKMDMTNVVPFERKNV